jgi:hypothetical protein
LEVLLLLALVTANPHRINRQSRAIRMLSLVLAALLSLANVWSVARLVTGLVQGTEGNTAGPGRAAKAVAHCPFGIKSHQCLVDVKKNSSSNRTIRCFSR